MTIKQMTILLKGDNTQIYIKLLDVRLIQIYATQNQELKKVFLGSVKMLNG